MVGLWATRLVWSLQLQARDSVEVTAVASHERQAAFERSRGDHGVGNLQAGLTFYTPRPSRDLRADLDLLAILEQSFDSGLMALVAREQLGSRNDRDSRLVGRQMTAAAHMVDQNVRVQKDIGHPLSPLDRVPIPIETVLFIAVGVWEVRRDAEGFVQYALALCAPLLLGPGAVGRQILVERRADHLRQAASIARAQLLNLTALLIGQVDLGACSRHTAQYTAKRGWARLRGQRPTLPLMTLWTRRAGFSWQQNLNFFGRRYDVLRELEDKGLLRRFHQRPESIAVRLQGPHQLVIFGSENLFIGMLKPEAEMEVMRVAVETICRLLEPEPRGYPNFRFQWLKAWDASYDDARRRSAEAFLGVDHPVRVTDFALVVDSKLDAPFDDCHLEFGIVDATEAPRRLA